MHDGAEEGGVERQGALERVQLLAQRRAQKSEQVEVHLAQLEPGLGVRGVAAGYPLGQVQGPRGPALLEHALQLQQVAVTRR